MQFEIKNRWTGAVIFTAEIECGPDEPLSIRLGLAVKAAAKAKASLEGANLRGAYLAGAYLGGAYLGSADLGGANLGGADLRGAYLGGADLRGAYLGGADLGGLIPIARATRSDGYEYLAWSSVLGGMVITAGCRTWQDGSVHRDGGAIADARKHCQSETSGRYRQEALDIVDFIEARSRAVLAGGV